jgi:Icc-related predicted phosphoesterase
VGIVVLEVPDHHKIDHDRHLASLQLAVKHLNTKLNRCSLGRLLTMVKSEKTFFLFVVLCLSAGLWIYRAHKVITQSQPPELQQTVPLPFRFIAFGDTRFTDGGDIVYDGSNAEDWNVYDAETKLWREQKIPVYPAIGNHDLKGDQATALVNYFERFPELQQSRFYSVRLANCLMMVLDSDLDELSGAQGKWLKRKLATIPADIAFVIIVMHHPPYTGSSDANKFGGGHSARPSEQAFASWLEVRQKEFRARFLVFAGHIHNYERHEHGGVTYFVTGGGGAHAYPIERTPDDKYQNPEINYHYLLANVTRDAITVTMNRLALKDRQALWTVADSVTVTVATVAR